MGTTSKVISKSKKKIIQELMKKREKCILRLEKLRGEYEEKIGKEEKNLGKITQEIVDHMDGEAFEKCIALYINGLPLTGADKSISTAPPEHFAEAVEQKSAETDVQKTEKFAENMNQKYIEQLGM